ncbi:hypothetical protein TNCV_894071 [Trichonephila clavipes]|nr:hypothetical protein TNCV_894071 [Trichonephila clavipes]
MPCAAPRWSMVEHLVMGLKTSPNHIGLGSALETGGWQFIDQHGYMRRLNQVNLSGFHRSQAKGKVFFGKKYVVVNVNHSLVGIFEQSVWISQQAFGCFFPHHVAGSKFIDMLCLHDGTFEIVQPRLFLMPMVFTKQNKHPFGGGLLVDDTSSDLALPSSIFQCIGFIGQRHGHTMVERCSGKASIGSMTNEKCLKHLSLLCVSNRMRFNKEAAASLNASVTVPPWMSGQTWSVEKNLGSKKF